MTNTNLNPMGTRRFGFWAVLLAFVVGIAGTAALMSRLTRPTSAPAPAEKTENAASKPGETGEEGKKTEAGEAGRIKLSAEAKETAGIRVEPVRMVPMGESLTVPGTVEVSPNREAKITPPAPGKIARLLVSLGDTVRAWQPVAVLDSFEVAQAQAAVRQAESSVQQARAALQTARAGIPQSRAGVSEAQVEVRQARTKQASAETALQRQKDLAAAGAFSQAPLQTAQSDLSEAQSALLRAQNDLQAQTTVAQRAERLFKAELVSRAELEQAQAEFRKDQNEVERAQARVNLAKQTLEREQKVFKGDLLTKQAVQTAEAEVRTAQGDVLRALQGVARAQQDVHKSEKEEQAARTALRGAEAAVAAAHANLSALAGTGSRGSLVTLTAPISGTITERRGTLGEAVERASPLFVIESLNTVLVEASVPEKDEASVRVGQQVEVTASAYPRLRFTGVVQSIAGRVDEKTRALPVRCVVENRGGVLRPEMFAKVSVGVGARSSALTVPVSALDQDGNAQYLYVEEQGEYERRKVRTGRRNSTHVEVLDGVKAGERVVVEGVFVLKSESKKGELKGDKD